MLSKKLMLKLYIKKSKIILLELLVFVLIIFIPANGNNEVIASTLSNDASSLINKVSKAYTNKFCNSIAFGLSKESAMNFSIEENNKAYKKKMDLKNINKDLLAEEIAISVIENCGYPINLSGEKGIQEFKIYYLSKDEEIK
mgnify:CR=1 FL=1